MFYNKNDLYFSYRHVWRFVIINQWFFVVNTNQIPLLKKLVFFFKIYNLIDLDDVRSFNYAYLFRFFFGKKSVFTKLNLKFHLGIHYYTFVVYCFFFKQECYFPIAVFLNDILMLSSDQFFFSGLTVRGNIFSC